MARFQATTTSVLEEELDALRQEMGLRENQKAELLRELASIAAWMFAQVRAGRTIEAHGPSGVEAFDHPALRAAATLQRVVLPPDEVARLAEMLDAEPEMTAALRATLARLTAPDRKPPDLRWPGR